jgi:iron complex outermembrane receptor protein
MPRNKHHQNLLRLISRGTAFTSLLFFMQPSFAAADDYLDLSLEQLLSAKVVSATKTLETVAQTPAAVYVITSEDIARSGVTSIADALRMAPGVDVAQSSTGTWEINIRGFNKSLADQLLVMIDGRTIYNPLFAGTYWELQNLPLEDIARIEVIRGPGGTLWSANAVNGVINVITKKAQDTQGHLIQAAGGTFQQDLALGQVGAKTSDGSYYRVYAQHLNDGPMRATDGGDAVNSLRDSRTGFRYDQDDNLTVSGDAYVNTTDQLTSVPQVTAPYATTQDDAHASQGANLLAHWKKNYDDGAQFSLQSYVDYTSRDQVTLKDQEDIFDVDAQYNMRAVGPNQFIVGGGYRLTHENIGDTPTLAINPSVNNWNLYNVFAQDKIALVPDRWFLTLGSKLEHNDYTGFEVEPNARLQWFPDNKQTVWTAVSRAVRTPSPLESNLNLNALVFPPHTGGLNSALPFEYNLIANPSFHSENVVAYEAGYRNKITPTVSTDVAAFANDYTGLAAQQLVGVATAPAGGPPQYGLLQTEQANLMTAETYGTEVAADWNVLPTWRLSGSASFLEMYLHLNNDFTNQQAEEGESPQQQYNVRSYWNINDKWSFDTAAYYVGKLPAFDIPAYVRVDANLGWNVEPGIQLNFVGQNLLQATHIEYGNTTDLDAAEVPRSFYAKVTCKF